MAGHTPWSELKHKNRHAAVRGNVVASTELATLSNERLVELIEQRSNLEGDAAREALAIIRGEIPLIEGDTVTIADRASWQPGDLVEVAG